MAQSQPLVERAAVLFSAVYPLKLLLRLLTPRLLIVKRHGGSVAESRCAWCRNLRAIKVLLHLFVCAGLGVFEVDVARRVSEAKNGRVASASCGDKNLEV